MIVTGSATVLHLARNEFGPAATTTLLFALLALVAYGRRQRAVTMASFDCNSPRTLGSDEAHRERVSERSARARRIS